MKRMSRRQFLRWLGIQAGAALSARFLTGCSASAPPEATPAPPPATGQPTPFLPAPPTEKIEPTVTASAITYPDLVVARGGEPEELVRRAVAALGGMARFVRTGADVIIKPNICTDYHTYEYASTTNPWVVGALVKLCFEAGAGQVRVMDFPFGGSADRAYAKSGIQEQVLAAGGSMEVMKGLKFVKVDIPEGLDLRRLSVFDDVLAADVLINVPIAKHHSAARLTLGMKNLMGVIADRPSIHINIGQRLADLTSLIRPELTVIDAVRILTAHGPTGGNLDDVKKLDTVIVSPDIVAADSYAAGLFNLTPDDLSYVRAGAAMGLGKSDLSSLRIEEVAVGA